MFLGHCCIGKLIEPMNPRYWLGDLIRITCTAPSYFTIDTCSWCVNGVAIAMHNKSDAYQLMTFPERKQCVLLAVSFTEKKIYLFTTRCNPTDLNLRYIIRPM